MRLVTAKATMETRLEPTMAKQLKSLYLRSSNDTSFALLATPARKNKKIVVDEKALQAGN